MSFVISGRQLNRNKPASTEPSADMHQRGRFEECSRRVFHAVTAGCKKLVQFQEIGFARRVCDPAKHQIEIVLFRPCNLIGAVRQQNPETVAFRRSPPGISLMFVRSRKTKVARCRLARLANC